MIVRSTRVWIVSATGAFLGLASLARAQQRATAGGGERAALEGVAFDSLRGAPLVGAFISLSGTERTTLSDSSGRFRFDAVARGPQTLVLLHSWLDSVGLSGVSTRVVVGDGTVARIGIPSFATLWRAACGDATLPSDRGFIFGSVRNAADRRPSGGVTVGVRWMDLTVDGPSGIAQHAWSGEVTTDSAGDYAVCGVPTDATLRVVATTDSAATGVIDVESFGTRVIRRDLVIAEESASDSIEPGSVVGVVRDRQGNAIPGARVVTAGAEEARSGPDGRFVLRGVPLGTRQLEVTSIGSAPAAVVVDVARGETAAPPVVMQPVVTLAAVTTRARSPAQRRLGDIAERRRLGYGMVMDSTRVGHLTSLRNAIDLMSDKFLCRKFYLDGRKVDETELKFRNPLDIALIERLHDFEAPQEMRPPPNCYAFLIWTKSEIR